MTDKSTIAYANMLIKANEPEWIAFAGRVLLVGLKMNLDLEQIGDYVTETYHHLSIDEIPRTFEETEKDMMLIGEVPDQPNEPGMTEGFHGPYKLER